MGFLENGNAIQRSIQARSFGDVGTFMQQWIDHHTRARHEGFKPMGKFQFLDMLAKIRMVPLKLSK